MKLIKHENVGWDNKINFVDDFNMVVGYDMAQNCCEFASWCVLDSEPTCASADESRSSNDFESYRFDPEYFRELPDPSRSMDDGAAVCFRLAAEGKPDKFLMLFNVHNGYYSHGFTVEVGGQVVREGSL